MINNPWYVQIILSMVWPFLTPKLRGRVSTFPLQSLIELIIQHCCYQFINIIN